MRRARLQVRRLASPASECACACSYEWIEDGREESEDVGTLAQHRHWTWRRVRQVRPNPLWWAVYCKQAEMVKLLLRAGGDPTTANPNRSNA